MLKPTSPACFHSFHWILFLSSNQNSTQIPELSLGFLLGPAVNSEQPLQPDTHCSISSSVCLGLGLSLRLTHTRCWQFMWTLAPSLLSGHTLPHRGRRKSKEKTSFKSLVIGAALRSPCNDMQMCVSDGGNVFSVGRHLHSGPGQLSTLWSGRRAHQVFVWCRRSVCVGLAVTHRASSDPGEVITSGAADLLCRLSCVRNSWNHWKLFVSEARDTVRHSSVKYETRLDLDRPGKIEIRVYHAYLATTLSVSLHFLLRKLSLS